MATFREEIEQKIALATAARNAAFQSMFHQKDTHAALAEYLRLKADAFELTKILAKLDQPPAAAAPDEPMRTGAPGRPTKGMHLVVAEAQRRRQAGTARTVLKTESEELHDWFRQNYPDRQAPTAKTIKNNIMLERRACREAKAQN